MNFDFSRWAIVAYNDDTGLGRMAQDAKAVLGVRQLVVPSARLATKPLDPARDQWLRADASAEEIETLLADLDGLILLEKPDWHPLLVPTARRLGRTVVAVPMWEWFRGTDHVWSLVDRILCPSEFSARIVRSYGFANVDALTWTLDLARFPARQISGAARIFFHNAGLIDHDDRKGTRDAIEAFLRVRRTDLRLVVRLQQEAPLPRLDGRIDVHIGNLAAPEALYAEGDVAIQPSKMEGVGFMVLEPVCCGIPTITTDYSPMSDYVLQPELRAAKRWFRRSSFPRRAAAIKHAHLRLPRLGDLARRIEWCAEHDLGAISCANRQLAEQRFNPARLRAEWAAALA